MEFCPKCGCVLMKKEDSSGCPRCGYESESQVNLETSEKIKVKLDVAVVDENSEDIHPVMDAKCPKCENDKAFFWMLQTRASDEAATRFFRCTKCRHTWREYR